MNVALARDLNYGFLANTEEGGMSSNNSKPFQDQSHDRRALWERPALRRLAANEAQGGANPGNDGKGGGSGSNVEHS